MPRASPREAVSFCRIAAEEKFVPTGNHDFRISGCILVACHVCRPLVEHLNCGGSPMKQLWFRLVASFLLLTSTLCSQDFKKTVIYQVVTDRFFDGDTTNNNPSQ